MFTSEMARAWGAGAGSQGTEILGYGDFMGEIHADDDRTRTITTVAIYRLYQHYVNAYQRAHTFTYGTLGGYPHP